MGIPQAAQFVYLSVKLDKNNIGVLGCSYLSQASKGGLEEIDLGIFVKKVGHNKVDD